MARAPRCELAGELFHVTARGSARLKIFTDDRDRWRYLWLLARTTRRVGWSCLSYCLMGNHIHLLIEAEVVDLSRGMHRLQGAYASAFNRRHGGSGHVFEDRFNSQPVTSELHLLATVRYIANNPVAAGLCDDPAAWPWSSHGALLRGETPSWLDVPRLYAYLAVYGGDPRRRYAELLNGARHPLSWRA